MLSNKAVHKLRRYPVILLGIFLSSAQAAELNPAGYQQWRLPDVAPSPANNKMDYLKAELGKKLFFDPRLSGNGKMSCATCHDPKKGWSDGLATARGHQGKILARATPTIVNVGFNEILMWDGRNNTLEQQALGPIINPDEMHNTKRQLVKTLKSIPGYVKEFTSAYHGLSISSRAIRQSIAMYQRQVVGNQSPFDRWLAGDGKALSDHQILGFNLFVNPNKANCARCHRPPNFTDNGFHNIGLRSFGKANPDIGRQKIVPVKMARGAFKTPSLRNIAQTAPYFHDGSAKSLTEVIKHYMSGGVVKDNLSPNMKALNINRQERTALVAFLKSLTSELDPSLTQYELPR